MPLNVFIDQVENGTIDPDIYDQFAHAIKDTEQTYYEKISKELNILETKYQCVLAIVKGLELYLTLDQGGDIHTHELWTILKQLLPVRATDTLQIVLHRSAILIQQIEIKKAELERLKPMNEFQTADRKYFTHLAIQVTKFLKVQVDKFKTTIAEFAEMIIDMRETNNQLVAEMKKHAR